MSKPLLLLRIFNTLAIAIIFAIVGFLSFAFYLGNRETHQLLKQHLVENFLLRFGGYALFGFWLSLLPLLINALVVWRTSLPAATVYRFALKAMAASTVAALGGTAVFFSH